MGDSPDTYTELADGIDTVLHRHLNGASATTPPGDIAAIVDAIGNKLSITAAGLAALEAEADRLREAHGVQIEITVWWPPDSRQLPRDQLDRLAGVEE